MGLQNGKQYILTALLFLALGASSSWLGNGSKKDVVHSLHQASEDAKDIENEIISAVKNGINTCIDGSQGCTITFRSMKYKVTKTKSTTKLQDLTGTPYDAEQRKKDILKICQDNSADFAQWQEKQTEEYNSMNWQELKQKCMNEYSGSDFKITTSSINITGINRPSCSDCGDDPNLASFPISQKQLQDLKSIHSAILERLSETAKQDLKKLEAQKTLAAAVAACKKDEKGEDLDLEGELDCLWKTKVLAEEDKEKRARLFKKHIASRLFKMGQSRDPEVREDALTELNRFKDKIDGKLPKAYAAQIEHQIFKQELDGYMLKAATQCGTQSALPNGSGIAGPQNTLCLQGYIVKASNWINQRAGHIAQAYYDQHPNAARALIAEFRGLVDQHFRAIVQNPQAYVAIRQKPVYSIFSESNILGGARPQLGAPLLGGNMQGNMPLTTAPVPSYPAAHYPAAGLGTANGPMHGPALPPRQPWQQHQAAQPLGNQLRHLPQTGGSNRARVGGGTNYSTTGRPRTYNGNGTGRW